MLDLSYSYKFLPMCGSHWNMTLYICIYTHTYIWFFYIYRNNDFSFILWQLYTFIWSQTLSCKFNIGQSSSSWLWNIWCLFALPVDQGGDWGIKNFLSYGNGQIRIRCVLCNFIKFLVESILLYNLCMLSVRKLLPNYPSCFFSAFLILW